MVYRKLERVWRNNHTDYIFIDKFRKVFPELSKLDSEELCDRFSELNMDFYYEKKTEVNKLVRITLPFAIILMILMIICLPIVFMVTGKWGYWLDRNHRVNNWFRMLRLI